MYAKCSGEIVETEYHITTISNSFSELNMSLVSSVKINYQMQFCINLQQHILQQSHFLLEMLLTERSVNKVYKLQKYKKNTQTGIVLSQIQSYSFKIYFKTCSRNVYFHCLFLYQVFRNGFLTLNLHLVSHSGIFITFLYHHKEKRTCLC